jgi:hypothetical protein
MAVFERNKRRLSELTSELYHYTRLDAVRGIIRTQAIWASHFSQLNDKEEIEHSRNIWIEALRGPFASEMKKLAKGSLKIHRKIASAGGVEAASKKEAISFVNAFFTTSFKGGMSGVPFAPPYIASFCSHQSSSSYTKENGLLSQWRAYGGADSYAIVFDTSGVEALLASEGERGWYSFWQAEKVIYNTGDERASDAIRNVIDPMIDAWREGKLNADKFDIKDVISNFLRITTIIKHQGFQEEDEVRIVVCPYTKALTQLVELKTEAKFSHPHGIKEVKTIQRGAKVQRYISLFDELNLPLPIKRIIVGPSTDQARSLRHLAEIVERRYEIVVSKTPYLPAT